MPEGDRLRYVCALAYVDPGAGVEQMFFGECLGRRSAAPRGAGGFGYDPAFVPDDDPEGRTMSELTDSEKDAISHRGRAVREFVSWLRS